MHRRGDRRARRRAPGLTLPFCHQIRPRYAEVDQQGVVFNAHWLTYFDDACTRFFESLGYTPKESFFDTFDFMIVKAVLEWEGRPASTRWWTSSSNPAGSGTKSFDLRYRASVAARVVHRCHHVRQRHAVDARVGADSGRATGAAGGRARRLLSRPRAGARCGAGARTRWTRRARAATAASRRTAGRAASRARPRPATRRPG